MRDRLFWSDYFSVPQRVHTSTEEDAANQTKAIRSISTEEDVTNQAKAIRSIPAYVSRAELVIVLAPTIQVADGTVFDCYSWLDRGWCRLEAFANWCSSSKGHTLMIRSPEYVHWRSDWRVFTTPPGKGNFTCCKFNHTLPDGSSIECDKNSIHAVVEDLLQNKLDAARSDINMWRATKTIRRLFLDGLETRARRTKVSKCTLGGCVSLS